MPIITSLLDIDFYKFTMAQVAFRHFPRVRVKYGFTNRTSSVALVDHVSRRQLQEEIEYVRTLRFTPQELTFLREGAHIPKGLFCEDFLRFLQHLKLPEVCVRKAGPQYRIETEGPWPEAIFWETIILSIVNELYFRNVLKENVVSEAFAWMRGAARLTSKVAQLQENPSIRFTDFGTRRRFSREWQRVVVGTLAHKVPDQLLGTSNVLLAREFGISSIGTFAHEMDMVFAGIFHGSDEEIRASHQRVLKMWWDTYGEPLSVALTDTYGSEFFFRDFTEEHARKWRGLRQDSGDAIGFGEKAAAFYVRNHISPREKLIVFSDGLDIDAIVRISRYFQNRIHVSFEWGTNLTNDLGFGALSLVVKVTEANGHRTVKLSDNLAKATGTSQDIQRFKRIFGYSGSTFEECRY